MLFKLFFLMMLALKVKCHTPKNTSDVIVTYEGHAEAQDNRMKVVTEKEVKPPTTEHYNNIPVEDDKDEVVFLPHEKELDHYRTDDEDSYYREDGIKIKDILANKRTVGELVDRAHLQTEPPSQDILFISGKNKEDEENGNEYQLKSKEKHMNARRQETKKIHEKLNCSDLECNNTVKSICGGKLENRQWKYRLFLNECYFRKVNCAFKHEMNRYIEVQKVNCKLVGDHYSEKPYYFKPMFVPIVKPDMTETIRNSSARRSLHIMMDGGRCPHPCPITCTNDYEPECAVTNTGERRVFVNHCKLDYNSCWNGIIWRKRPMSECVGGKKADMHQNRAFITWMQRVGIVDNKGRLSLS